MNCNTPSSVIIDLYQTLSQKNILFAFHGQFDYETVNTVLKTLKKILHQEKFTPRSIIKKTYNILVEGIENIYRHGAITNSSETKKEGIIVLSSTQNSYQLFIGNLIKKSEQKNLQKKIDMLNQMNKEELKTYYRETILKGQISKKGGAGLGIIDIAIRSNSKLHYTFYPYNDTLVFFLLTLHIKFKTS